MNLGSLCAHSERHHFAGFVAREYHNLTRKTLGTAASRARRSGGYGKKNGAKKNVPPVFGGVGGTAWVNMGMNIRTCDISQVDLVQKSFECLALGLV